MSQLSAGLHLALVTAKFGLTGGVSVALASWLVPKDILSVAFVALLCIQPSLVTGLKAAKEQLLASGIGAISTLCFLLVFPINPWTIGASVAATYAVTTRLRWGYSALVVALFSSLYMTLLVQATHVQTGILRFQAVLLGVAVALFMNAVFSPVFTQVNLAVRIQRSVATVRQQLAALRAALVAKDASTLEAGLGTFQDTFRHLGAVKDDLADLRREMRLPGRPGRRSFTEVYFSDRCVRELELITHHAQDVAMASQRLLRESDGGAQSAVALGMADGALLQALDVLDLVQEGHYDRAEAIAA
ncbi:MAG: FUSC family protein, partial [Candidatus Sericytochromatia bacterium]